MIANMRNDLRQHGRAWLATALTVVFGLQLLRVLFVSFVGYLRDTVGLSSLSLAPIAVGIFALSLLAGPLNRFAGTRNALWITAGGTGLSRLVEQISQSAPLDLYFSSAGAVLFLMYIPIAVGIARAQKDDAPIQLGIGFLLGISLDSAIQLAGRTLDLSWQPGILPIIIVAAFLVLQLWALISVAINVKETRDGSWLSSLALLALGPWLFLQLLIFQNNALFASLTGWQTPAAGITLIFGNIVGIWFASRLASPRSSYLHVIFSAVFMLFAVLKSFETSGLISAAFLILGQGFSFGLGMLIFVGSSRVQGNKGLLRTTLFNGLGQILFVLLLFVYYASYDIEFGLRSSVLRPVGAALATVFTALAFLGKPNQQKAETAQSSPVRLAATLLVIPLVLAVVWKTPTAAPAPTGTTSLRVMDYNLHDAVNAAGRVDPEALAQAIEASGAELVTVQEISRGWLIWGGMDMLTWLSQRLNMPYVWASTADPQWGMAVFSRYPIISSEYFQLPPEDILLFRGFQVIKIDVGGQTLTVINNHFSEKDSQDQIRAIQASAVLDFWNGQPLTILAGDLNAKPDSLAITILLNGGLVDVSREIGQQPTYTYSSVNPDHQIDFIFVSPDLGYSDFVIPRTTASDHLPIITTITLP